MQKDSVRDYITTAFRIYSALGRPDENTINSMSRSTATKLDLLAVDKTIKKLCKNNQINAYRAIEAVYFPEPTKQLKKNEIHNRVIAFATENFVSERNVWYWLKQAIHTCAKFRGLNTSPLCEIVDDN